MCVINDNLLARSQRTTRTTSQVLHGLKAQKESCPFGAYVSNDVYVVRRVKSVKSDKSVFDTSSFSEIKNIGLL